MIELNVEPYCHSCHGFVPDTVAHGIFEDEPLMLVECQYRNRCAGMYRHILSEVRKNEKGETDG